MRRFLKLKKLNRQHVTFVLLLILIAYVSIATLSVIARNYQLQQQIDQLTTEKRTLELQNQQLTYQITYYKTDAFVEKEARSKLNLQAPGERVVIFPDKVPEPKTPGTEPEPKLGEKITNNLKEWLFFLFRIDL